MTRTAPLSRITESWDTAADDHQWELARQRYGLASLLARGRVVAEIGCGTGFGLARVVDGAERAIGIDLDEANLREARRRAPACQFVCGDATALPLQDQSIEVLVALEMIYYIEDQPLFFREAARVLRLGGKLLLTMPNPTRRYFQRSPFCTNYPTFDELTILLASAGLAPTIYGSLPLGAVRPFHEGLRRMLVTSRLMPTTIRGRSRLKSVVNRRMRRLGDLELDPDSAFVGLTPVESSGDSSRYAVWVAVATRVRDDGTT
ncbi:MULTISPECIES: class I SAM-dependent methyltransferase [unclassified Nocardioides]|uniref:class I SAM-dependent methyltransferase n=1 Tax=unclassified Nocardioides TaxID=2615069 RepID=UPI0000EB62F1|nr:MULTISPECIES: class I SAM-dependent methyltransferase [unclassified Nocardioides]ABL83715.1 Methyltransferase type 11 [Nocardioides sp. JS614]